MIKLTNVSKAYPRDGQALRAIQDLSLTIGKSDRVGVIGKNGSGKSTLIRLIGGAEIPTLGTIERRMSVSWPLAMRGGMSPHLSGLSNIRFLSRVYQLPFEDMVEVVKEFSELGDRLKDPVSTYSSGMRAKFSFGVSLTIEFDCYLIDEIVAVGDKIFRKKCRRELVEKRGDRAMLMVAHQANTIQQYCNSCILMENGRILDRFDTNERSWRKYA